MLELTDIDAGYGRTRVLHGVTVPAGKVVAVLGHNGAGKTTLLRVAIGLIKPSKGRVLFDGVDLHLGARHGDGLARRERQSVPELAHHHLAHLAGVVAHCRVELPAGGPGRQAAREQSAGEAARRPGDGHKEPLGGLQR